VLCPYRVCNANEREAQSLLSEVVLRQSDTKKCTGCDEVKPVTEFYRNKKARDGRRWECKACSRKAARGYVKLNANRVVIELPTEQRCSSCRIVKPADQFHKNKTTKSGLQCECKRCIYTRLNTDEERAKRRKYQKDYRKRNPEYAEKQRRQSLKYQANMKEMRRHVKAKGCMICGYSQCLSAIEFHHIDGKRKETQVSLATSPQKLRAEMAKCVVVCANCHREIHEGMHTITYNDKQMHLTLPPPGRAHPSTPLTRRGCPIAVKSWFLKGGLPK
jgi:hypothetical protein